MPTSAPRQFSNPKEGSTIVLYKRPLCTTELPTSRALRSGQTHCLSPQAPKALIGLVLARAHPFLLWPGLLCSPPFSTPACAWLSAHTQGRWTGNLWRGRSHPDMRLSAPSWSLSKPSEKDKLKLASLTSKSSVLNACQMLHLCLKSKTVFNKS